MSSTLKTECNPLDAKNVLKYLIDQSEERISNCDDQYNLWHNFQLQFMIAFQVWQTESTRIYRPKNVFECEHYRVLRSVFIENILKLFMLFDLFLSI